MLILESVINRYLSLDPELHDKIALFGGKVIKIEVCGLSGMSADTIRLFYIFPGKDGIQISTSYSGQVDTVIRGSAVSLFKMGLISNAADMLLKGEVEISGDTRLGHQFKNLIAQMDIDWSAPLATMFGDAASCQMMKTGDNIRRWSSDSVKSVASSLSEYLQEESRDVVTETELDMFNRAVDQCRDDVDRLSARVRQLLDSKEEK